MDLSAALQSPPPRMWPKGAAPPLSHSVFHSASGHSRSTLYPGDASQIEATRLADASSSHSSSSDVSGISAGTGSDDSSMYAGLNSYGSVLSSTHVTPIAAAWSLSSPIASCRTDPIAMDESSPSASRLGQFPAGATGALLFQASPDVGTQKPAPNSGDGRVLSAQSTVSRPLPESTGFEPSSGARRSSFAACPSGSDGGGRGGSVPAEVLMRACPPTPQRGHPSSWGRSPHRRGQRLTDGPGMYGSDDSSSSSSSAPRAPLQSAASHGAAPADEKRNTAFCDEDDLAASLPDSAVGSMAEGAHKRIAFPAYSASSGPSPRDDLCAGLQAANDMGCSRAGHAPQPQPQPPESHLSSSSSGMLHVSIPPCASPTSSSCESAAPVTGCHASTEYGSSGTESLHIADGSGEAPRSITWELPDVAAGSGLRRFDSHTPVIELLFLDPELLQQQQQLENDCIGGGEKAGYAANTAGTQISAGGIGHTATSSVMHIESSGSSSGSDAAQLTVCAAPRKAARQPRDVLSTTPFFSFSAGLTDVSSPASSGAASPFFSLPAAAASSAVLFSGTGASYPSSNARLASPPFARAKVERSLRVQVAKAASTSSSSRFGRSFDPSSLAVTPTAAGKPTADTSVNAAEEEVAAAAVSHFPFSSALTSSVGSSLHQQQQQSRVTAQGGVFHTESSSSSSRDALPPGTTVTTSSLAAAAAPVVSFDSSFIVRRPLGSGSFSVVVEVEARPGRGGGSGRFALKKCTHGLRSQRDLTERMREVVLAAGAGPHPHLMRYWQAWREDSNLFIQTELCPGGSLEVAVRNMRVHEATLMLNASAGGPPAQLQRGAADVNVAPSGATSSLLRRRTLSSFSVGRIATAASTASGGSGDATPLGMHMDNVTPRPFPPPLALGALPRTPVPEDVVWTLLAHVGAGLAHLHAHGVAHLDIKPDNVLLGADGALRIGDLGMAVNFVHAPPAATQRAPPLLTHSSSSSSSGSVGIGGGNDNALSTVAGGSDLLGGGGGGQPLSGGIGMDDDVEGDSRYMAGELLNVGGRGPPADMFSLGLSAFELAWNISPLPAEGPMWHDLREGRLPPPPSVGDIDTPHATAASSAWVASLSSTSSSASAAGLLGTSTHAHSSRSATGPTSAISANTASSGTSSSDVLLPAASLSSDLVRVITALCEPDPARRPTAEALLGHPRVAAALHAPVACPWLCAAAALGSKQKRAMEAFALRGGVSHTAAAVRSFGSNSGSSSDGGIRALRPPSSSSTLGSSAASFRERSDAAAAAITSSAILVVSTNSAPAAPCAAVHAEVAMRVADEDFDSAPHAATQCGADASRSIAYFPSSSSSTSAFCDDNAGISAATASSSTAASSAPSRSTGRTWGRSQSLSSLGSSGGGSGSGSIEDSNLVLTLGGCRRVSGGESSARDATAAASAPFSSAAAAPYSGGAHHHTSQSAPNDNAYAPDWAGENGPPASPPSPTSASPILSHRDDGDVGDDVDDDDVVSYRDESRHPHLPPAATLYDHGRNLGQRHLEGASTAPTAAAAMLPLLFSSAAGAAAAPPRQAHAKLQHGALHVLQVQQPFARRPLAESSGTLHVIDEENAANTTFASTSSLSSSLARSSVNTVRGVAERSSGGRAVHSLASAVGASAAANAAAGATVLSSAESSFIASSDSGGGGEEEWAWADSQDPMLKLGADSRESMSKFDGLGGGCFEQQQCAEAPFERFSYSVDSTAAIRLGPQQQQQQRGLLNADAPPARGEFLSGSSAAAARTHALMSVDAPSIPSAAAPMFNFNFVNTSTGGPLSAPAPNFNFVPCGAYPAASPVPLNNAAVGAATPVPLLRVATALGAAVPVVHNAGSINTGKRACAGATVTAYGEMPPSLPQFAPQQQQSAAAAPPLGGLSDREPVNFNFSATRVARALEFDDLGGGSASRAGRRSSEDDEDGVLTLKSSPQLVLLQQQHQQYIERAQQSQSTSLYLNTGMPSSTAAGTSSTTIQSTGSLGLFAPAVAQQQQQQFSVPLPMQQRGVLSSSHIANNHFYGSSGSSSGTVSAGGAAALDVSSHNALNMSDGGATASSGLLDVSMASQTGSSGGGANGEVYRPYYPILGTTASSAVDSMMNTSGGVAVISAATSSVPEYEEIVRQQGQRYANQSLQFTADILRPSVLGRATPATAAAVENNTSLQQQQQQYSQHRYEALLPPMFHSDMVDSVVSVSNNNPARVTAPVPPATLTSTSSSSGGGGSGSSGTARKQPRRVPDPYRSRPQSSSSGASGSNLSSSMLQSSSTAQAQQQQGPLSDISSSSARFSGSGGGGGGHWEDVFRSEDSRIVSETATVSPSRPATSTSAGAPYYPTSTSITSRAVPSIRSVIRRTRAARREEEAITPNAASAAALPLGGSSTGGALIDVASLLSHVPHSTPTRGSSTRQQHARSAASEFNISAPLQFSEAALEHSDTSGVRGSSALDREHSNSAPYGGIRGGALDSRGRRPRPVYPPSPIVHTGTTASNDAPARGGPPVVPRAPIKSHTILRQDNDDEREEDYEDVENHPQQQREGYFSQPDAGPELQLSADGGGVPFMRSASMSDLTTGRQFPGNFNMEEHDTAGPAWQPPSGPCPASPRKKVSPRFSSAAAAAATGGLPSHALMMMQLGEEGVTVNCGGIPASRRPGPSAAGAGSYGDRSDARGQLDRSESRASTEEEVSSPHAKRAHYG